MSPGVLCRGAVQTFAAQPDGGIIVNIASRAAFRGEDPDYWHYAAAKAGIVAMTRTIARHYGRQGVTAFAIAPGYVDTAFNQAFRDEFGVEVAAADTGLGEVAQPQDVANVIAFLASGLPAMPPGPRSTSTAPATCDRGRGGSMGGEGRGWAHPSRTAPHRTFAGVNLSPLETRSTLVTFPSPA